MTHSLIFHNRSHGVCLFGGSAAGILQPKLDCQHETLMHLINSQVKDFKRF